MLPTLKAKEIHLHEVIQLLTLGVKNSETSLLGLSMTQLERRVMRVCGSIYPSNFSATIVLLMTVFHFSDSSTALIRVKYFQTTAVKKTNRRIDVKFRHLDLLGRFNSSI